MKKTLKMKKTLLLVLPFFICTVLLGQSTTEALSDELKKQNKEIQIPGYAAVILKNNQVIYQQGFGYADLATKKAYTPDLIQNIGSVSKTFIGIAIMKKPYGSSRRFDVFCSTINAKYNIIAFCNYS